MENWVSKISTNVAANIITIPVEIMIPTKLDPFFDESRVPIFLHMLHSPSSQMVSSQKSEK
jgi:hypothetical protein